MGGCMASIFCQICFSDSDGRDRFLPHLLDMDYRPWHMCGQDVTKKWLPRKICGRGVTNLWPPWQIFMPRCDQDFTILTDLWPRCDQDWPTERFVSEVGPICNHPDRFLAKVWPICDHPERFVAEMWPPWQICGQGRTNMWQIFSRDKIDIEHRR